jgi:hypothetical protein
MGLDLASNAGRDLGMGCIDIAGVDPLAAEDAGACIESSATAASCTGGGASLTGSNFAAGCLVATA